MAVPSTHLVLILALQANVIFDVDGLTLPLQTVTTKCESIIKKPPKPYQECVVNEKPTCDSLSSNLYSPRLPLDLSARSTIGNPIGNILANSQDGLYSAQAIAKDTSFTSKTCTDNFSILSNPNINTLIGNKPCGLKLPLAVSSAVTSLPPPNLKFSEFSKLPKQLSSLNCDPVASSTKPYSNDFKSSFTVSNLPSNCESRNINVSPAQRQSPKMIDVQSQNPNFLGFPETSIPNSYPNSLALSETCRNLHADCNNRNLNGNLPLNAISTTSKFLSQGLESNTVSSPNTAANKLASGFNNPMLSSAFISPQLTSSCFSEMPSLNKAQDCSIPVSDSSILQQSGRICPLSKLSQSSYIPGSVPFNINNFIASSCNNPTQSLLLPDSSAILSVQNSIVNPNVQMCPQSGSAISSEFDLLPGSNPLMTNENSMVPYTSSLSVNPNSPIIQYFKEARAATEKLNDFVSSFSTKLASNNIPKLKSFVGPSQTSLQSNCMSIEEKVEPTPLISCSSPMSLPSPLSQPNVIPYEVPFASKNTAITLTQSCVDNTPSLTPPVVPVSFKAPIVPKTIASMVNFPFCSAPVQSNSLQDNLASLSINNYSPYPFSNLPTNPYYNFDSCINNLPDGSLISSLPTISSFRPISLPSVLKRPALGKDLLNSINNCDDFTNMIIPDVLSTLLPKPSYACDVPCKKPLPYISSISINRSPDCIQVNDSTVEATAEPATQSDLDDIILDALNSSIFNSPIASFLSPEPTFDESEIDLCCKNLENIISILESQISFNNDVERDMDTLSDFLSSMY